MAHNEFVFWRGVVDDHTVPTPAHLRKLDQLASESVNIVEGGSFNPATPIFIGGAGVELNGTTCKLMGGVETTRGSAGVIIGVGTEVLIEPAASRTIMLDLLDDLRMTTLNNGNNSASFIPVYDPWWGLQHIEREAGYSTRKLIMMLPHNRVHNGARLERARLRLRFTKQQPTTDLAAGASLMMRLVRVPYTAVDAYSPVNLGDMYVVPTFVGGAFYSVGDIVIPTIANLRQYRCLASGAAGASSAGWSAVLGDTVPSGSAAFLVEPQADAQQARYHMTVLPYEPTLVDTAITHFAKGLPFDFDFVPTQNQVIDTDNYSYFLMLQSPSSAAPIYHSLTLQFSQIGTLAEP